MKHYLAICILPILLLVGCKITEVSEAPIIDAQDKNQEIKTKYVFVLVIDGTRWSETFGDSTYKNVPNQANKLKKQGVFFNNFTNQGRTYTISGHTAITTGYYQSIDNGGSQLPKRPSIFQYYLDQYDKDKRDSWILTSKGKLQVLGDTKNKDWNREHMPATYCGTNGSGTGYPNDRNIWPIFKEIIKTNHPELTLINLLDPDAWAHQKEWERYIEGIQQSDRFALDLWKLIQSDPVYKNKTTLFITNDHGRHLPDVKSGYVSHGDRCSGCRKIQLIGLGPDFKPGTEIDKAYDLIDITTTIAAMLNIKMPTDGQVMQELFE